jgi:5-carboxymethyl-2-hydroxymuconate isomerase
MPHVVIEYTKSLEFDIRDRSLMIKLHQIMIDSGLFNPDDIKTRAYVTDDFLIGNKQENGSFIHVTISILTGRTVEQRQTLSDNILKVIQEPFNYVDQITVNIDEMNRDTYRKYINPNQSHLV